MNKQNNEVAQAVVASRATRLRTQDEIAARMKSDNSLFGYANEALLPFLDFEHAKHFLKEAATEEQWSKERTELIEEVVRKELASYMEFAWSKVENHRGISASRSVDKCSAYVWLLGDDATVAAVEAADYAQYGAPKLAVICKSYGLFIPSEAWAQRMIAGQVCGLYDDCGCGQ